MATASNDHLAQDLGSMSPLYSDSEDDKSAASVGQSILKLKTEEQQRDLQFCPDSPSQASSASCAAESSIDRVYTFSFESGELDSDCSVHCFSDGQDEQIEWQPNKRPRNSSAEVQEIQIVSPEDVARDNIDVPLPTNVDVGIQPLLLSDLPNEMEIQELVRKYVPNSTLKPKGFQFDVNHLDALDGIRSKEDNEVDHLLLPARVEGGNENYYSGEKKFSQSLQEMGDSLPQSARTQARGVYKSRTYDDDQSKNDPRDPFLGGVANSMVFQTLQAYIPLQESLKPVVLLLIQIELSISTTSVVKRACSIVQETLESTPRPLDARVVMGTIFESLVQKLGCVVDLDRIFQASAQGFHAGDSCNIFFQPRSIPTPLFCGYRRDKIRSHRFVPTMMQLAIAYGVHHANKVKRRRMPLEAFLKQASTDLETMSDAELEGIWNTLVGLY